MKENAKKQKMEKENFLLGIIMKYMRAFFLVYACDKQNSDT